LGKKKERPKIRNPHAFKVQSAFYIQARQEKEMGHIHSEAGRVAKAIKNIRGYE